MEYLVFSHLTKFLCVCVFVIFVPVWLGMRLCFWSCYNWIVFLALALECPLPIIGTVIIVCV